MKKYILDRHKLRKNLKILGFMKKKKRVVNEWVEKFEFGIVGI